MPSQNDTLTSFAYLHQCSSFLEMQSSSFALNCIIYDDSVKISSSKYPIGMDEKKVKYERNGVLKAPIPALQN